MDLGIEVILELFSKEGLTEFFRLVIQSNIISENCSTNLCASKRITSKQLMQ